MKRMGCEWKSWRVEKNVGGEGEGGFEDVGKGIVLDIVEEVVGCKGRKCG